MDENKDIFFKKPIGNGHKNPAAKMNPLSWHLILEAPGYGRPVFRQDNPPSPSAVYILSYHKDCQSIRDE